MGSPVVQRLIPNIVCIGESLTSGSLSTGGEGSVNSYPGQLATTRGQTYDRTVINLGIGGLGVASLPEPEVFYQYGRPNIIVLSEGINDIYNSLTPAATLFASLQTYINARLAAGWRVVVCTLTCGDGIAQPSGHPIRTSYNTLIRNAYSGGAVANVALADIAANANIGDGANTAGAYFGADHYHLTDLGYGEMRTVINAVINATWQLSVALVTASGSALMSSTNTLTGWFRPDWSQRSTVKAEMYTLMNLIARRTFVRYLVESDQDNPGSHVQVTRVDNVLNGYPAGRFPGNQSGGSDLNAFMSSATTMASFITSTSVYMGAVLTPTTITSNNANPHFNECILGAAGGFGCGLGLRNNGGTYQVQGWTDDGAKQVATGTLPGVGSPVAVFMRLTGGNVSVRVGTQSSWGTPVASGAIGDLTGALRMGKFALNCLNADVFDAVIGTWDSTTDSNVGAYFRARYGVL